MLYSVIGAFQGTAQLNKTLPVIIEY